MSNHNIFIAGLIQSSLCEIKLFARVSVRA